MFLIDQIIFEENQYFKERSIEKDNAKSREASKKNIDQYLDKTKCMSCMAPIEEVAEFCPSCGSKF